MEENKINWNKIPKSSKDGLGKVNVFLMDEICCFDFKLPKSDEDWSNIAIFTDGER